MKNFIAEPIFKDPIPVDNERLNEIIREHEDFLRVGIADGWILFCGPKVNIRGGFVILKAESLEEIEKHFLNDPLQKEGIVTFRFTEFKLFECQQILRNWFI